MRSNGQVGLPGTLTTLVILLTFNLSAGWQVRTKIGYVAQLRNPCGIDAASRFVTVLKQSDSISDCFHRHFKNRQTPVPISRRAHLPLAFLDFLYPPLLGRKALISMLVGNNPDKRPSTEDEKRVAHMESKDSEGVIVPNVGSVGVACVVKECRSQFGGDLGTGFKVWDSGQILAKVLLSEYREQLPGINVLELGSGTGIGGLAAAAAGANVLLTDGSDGVLPLLEANVRANNLESNTKVCNMLWGYEPDEMVLEEGPYDLIIGSDLLYAPSSFRELLDTIVNLCVPGRTEVLLTFPLRYTEDSFFDEAAQRNLELMGSIAEVEPYLYKASLQLSAQ